MISIRQRKGLAIGLIWSLLAWIPYYTEYLTPFRNILGIPATLGLNLELALNRGDAFIFSMLLGVGIGFVFGTIIDFGRRGIKIIWLLPTRRKKKMKRGIW